MGSARSPPRKVPMAMEARTHSIPTACSHVNASPKKNTATAAALIGIIPVNKPALDASALATPLYHRKKDRTLAVIA